MREAIFYLFPPFYISFVFSSYLIRKFHSLSFLGSLSFSLVPSLSPSPFLPPSLHLSSTFHLHYRVFFMLSRVSLISFSFAIFPFPSYPLQQEWNVTRLSLRHSSSFLLISPRSVSARRLFLSLHFPFVLLNLS